MDGRVLIIEDHIGNRQILKKHFAAAGFEVTEAKSGKEGIKAAQRIMPQVILISSSLPDLSGADVVQQLRQSKLTEHMHLIMFADEESNQDKLSVLALGANDFVLSPFDPDEVTLRVRNALRRANMSNRIDPITGLPAGSVVQDQLRRLLDDPEGTWAIVRFRVTNLDPFREARGFMAGNELLRDMTAFLVETLSKEESVEDFLSYGGHDDFVVITDQARAAGLEEKVKAYFEEEILSHYDTSERAQGVIEVEGKQYAIAQLRSSIIVPQEGPFYDIRSLSEALAV